jgi:glycosyltransferase involved in cell wall biosynthesis
MRRTDIVAAVCEAARARFAAQGVRPRRALLAVPNGIRIDAFAPACEERRAALRSVLALPEGSRIIGTVGRLSPVKDQRALLQAFARLHAELRDTALVLVGDGALRAALEAEAAALGIAEVVRFLGDRGDVRQLLQGFDAFALSSLSEGYSMALLEACASGLPIVATDVGGNREIVADGGNGLLVPAARPEALSDALAAILGDPARAAAMGRAGRDWALREASIDTMAARYESLYRAEAMGP